jgi:ATP-dependent DNA helicase
MGLGKTLQTISFVAYLRERGVYGPFLIVCPLSTLGNWGNEFQRFAPEIPVLEYHGSPSDRAKLRKTKMQLPETWLDASNQTPTAKEDTSKDENESDTSSGASLTLKSSKSQQRGKGGGKVVGNTQETFPVILTTYELIIKDRVHLNGMGWHYVIVDESHRLKNMNCKLIRELKTYRAANRLLLTGTPLQVRRSHVHGSLSTELDCVGW